MADSQQMRENARRIVDIALADPNPIRSRQRIRSLLHDNPYIAEEAIRLDSPTFLLSQLDQRELRQFLESLSGAAVQWLYNWSPETRQVIEKNLSKARWSEASSETNISSPLQTIRASASASASQSQSQSQNQSQIFYDQFKAALEGGDITFDPGLIFGDIIQCSGEPRSYDMAYNIFCLSRIVQGDEAALFVISGPPAAGPLAAGLLAAGPQAGGGAREGCSFVVSFGEKRIWQKEFYFNENGAAFVEFHYRDCEKMLSQKERNADLQLLAAVDKGGGEVAAVRSFIVGKQSEAVEKRPLAIEILKSAYIEKGQILHANIDFKLYDGHLPYFGDTLFTLRCMGCNASVSTQELNIKRGTPELNISAPIFRHSGPFVMTATGEGSQRSTSIVLPGAYQSGTPAQSAVNGSTGGEVFHIEKSGGDESSIKFGSIRRQPANILYWARPAKDGDFLEDQLDNRESVGPAQAKRLGKFTFSTRVGTGEELKVGRGSTTLAASLGSSTFEIAHSFLPGSYELCIISIAGGKSNFYKLPFDIKEQIKWEAPLYYRQGDEISARLIIPASINAKVLDHQKKPVEPEYQNRGHNFYSLLLKQKEESSVGGGLVEGGPAEGGPNGGSRFYLQEGDRIEPIAKLNNIPAYPMVDNPVWEPLRQKAPDNLKDENIHKNINETIRPGTLLSLGDFIIYMAYNLSRYGMFCTEQISSILYGKNILQERGFHIDETDIDETDIDEADIDEADIDKAEESLIQMMENQWDPSLRLFRLWEGDIPAVKTTTRVICSLMRSKGAAEGFGRKTLNSIAESGQKITALSQFHSALKNGGGGVYPIWEKINDGDYTKEGAQNLLESLASKNETAEVFDKNEMEAMLFYLSFFDLPSQLERVVNVEVKLSFFKKVFVRLGLREAPANSKKIIIKNNSAQSIEKWKERFIVQGGVPLFMSTAASVALLQALVNLEKMGAELSFQKGEPLLHQNMKEIDNHDIAISPIESRWRIGRKKQIQVKLKTPRNDAIMTILCPSHSRVMAKELGVQGVNGSYIELPFQMNQSLTIEVEPFLKGKSELAIIVSSMYNPSWRGQVQKTITVIG